MRKERVDQLIEGKKTGHQIRDVGEAEVGIYRGHFATIGRYLVSLARTINSGNAGISEPTERLESTPSLIIRRIDRTRAREGS